jgi:hypothetical protein
MESCFGTLKIGLVHQACSPTRNAARHDLFASIEGYYYRQRLHSAPKFSTPEQAERQGVGPVCRQGRSLVDVQQRRVAMRKHGFRSIGLGGLSALSAIGLMLGLQQGCAGRR